MQFSNFSRIEDTLVIYFKNELPIQNVSSLKYFVDNTAGAFDKKEFRWSFNNIYWSAWETLTQKAVSSVDMHSNYYFFLEIRYTLIAADSGTVDSFTLNYIEGDLTAPTSSAHFHDDIETRDSSLITIHDFVQSKQFVKIVDASTLGGYSGAYYLDRTNHIGGINIAAVAGLDASLRAKVDKNGDIMTGDLIMSDASILMKGNIDMSTNHINEVGYIDFDLINGIEQSEGRLYWNPDDHTLNLGMEGGTGVNLQIGQEMLLRASNKSGVSMYNGDIVYVSGAQGSRPVVSLAQAGVPQAGNVIGIITQEEIVDNGTGYVTTTGLVRDINTNGMAAGSKIFLSHETPGVFTTQIPEPPNEVVLLGYIIVENPDSGVIYFQTKSRPKLSYLSDVSARGAQVDGDVLSWVTDGSYWKPSPASGGVSQIYVDGSLNEIRATYIPDVSLGITLVWTNGILDASVAGGGGVTQITDISILSADWSYVGGWYEYDISYGTITTNSLVDVIPLKETINIVKSAEFLPQTDSSDGSVKIYATNSPTGDIAIRINISELS